MSKFLSGFLVSFSILNGIPNTIEYTAEPVEEIIPQQQEMSDPLFKKIAWCESQHKLDAQNPSSTAKGEYQFLDGTWDHYAPMLWGEEWVTKDVLSLDNRELAWFVYTHYGTTDWEADPRSYECWKDQILNATHRNIY